MATLISKDKVKLDPKDVKKKIQMHTKAQNNILPLQNTIQMRLTFTKQENTIKHW